MISVPKRSAASASSAGSPSARATLARARACGEPLRPFAAAAMGLGEREQHLGELAIGRRGRAVECGDRAREVDDRLFVRVAGKGAVAGQPRVPYAERAVLIGVGAQVVVCDLGGALGTRGRAERLERGPDQPVPALALGRAELFVDRLADQDVREAEAPPVAIDLGQQARALGLRQLLAELVCGESARFLNRTQQGQAELAADDRCALQHGLDLGSRARELRADRGPQAVGHAHVSAAQASTARAGARERAHDLLHEQRRALARAQHGGDRLGVRLRARAFHEGRDVGLLPALERQPLAFALYAGEQRRGRGREARLCGAIGAQDQQA